MARFQYEKKQHTYRTLILSACIFLLIAFAFYNGTSSLSSDMTRRQKESLINALNRSITYCYAVEGAYPESLDYITKYYGVTYDEELFFVDYKINGANIWPDVTIIEKGD